MMADTHFPTLIGQVIPNALTERIPFPFRSWAEATKFDYPEAAADFLSQCGSAAEAFFAREFTFRPGVAFSAALLATAGDISLQLQARAGGYLLDAIASGPTRSLAIEIDGMAFHHRSKEQVRADYLRQRRIVLKGHTVIRFTAQEVFQDPKECWRQVDVILRSGNRGA